jgi:putative aminopeptidase FrvX
MITNKMKDYTYYILKNELDEYGQNIESTAAGTIKMNIYLNSQTVNNAVVYADVDYIGLTLAEIDDSMIIDFDGVKLKVKTVNSGGRFKVALLQKVV